MMLPRSYSFVSKGAQTTTSEWIDLFRSHLSRGLLKEALDVYCHNLPTRTQRHSLISILKVCASQSLFLLGQSLHTQSIKFGVDHDLQLGTTLVSMYSKCNQCRLAQRLFGEMPDKNLVTYNAMIGGYCLNCEMDLASVLFDSMPARTPVTWTEMISGYLRAGDTAAARHLFDKMPGEMRTVVTWTVMVDGYTTNGKMDEARALFDRMPARNCFVWSSMITGYFKKGDFGAAQAIFVQIPIRNLVNWNALIGGYTQAGCCEKALENFRQMQHDGFNPDEFTIASVLSACAQLGWLDYGKEVHDLIRRKNIKLNHFVMNGLIDMYAKCGDLETAMKVFNGMTQKNSTCWNSMISALASHGCNVDALKLFLKMEESNEEPNDITFLVVLSACAHGGLVQEGLDIFTKMEKNGVVARVKHYGCVIDLLGRAGRVAEAFKLIQTMHVAPNDAVLGALLGACKLHMEHDIADQVLHHVDCLNSRVENGNDARYVVLSNMYAASEKWQEAERMRRTMEENNMQKLPGCSAVMVGETKSICAMQG